jgi:hypothetical protein
MCSEWFRGRPGRLVSLRQGERKRKRPRRRSSLISEREPAVRGARERVLGVVIH